VQKNRRQYLLGSWQPKKFCDEAKGANQTHCLCGGNTEKKKVWGNTGRFQEQTFFLCTKRHQTRGWVTNHDKNGDVKSNKKPTEGGGNWRGTKKKKNMGYQKHVNKLTPGGGGGHTNNRVQPKSAKV